MIMKILVMGLPGAGKTTLASELVEIDITVGPHSELNNLANTKYYKSIKDSLSLILDGRITQAKKRPFGLGRQIKNARPWNEPKRINSKPK